MEDRVRARVAFQRSRSKRIDSSAFDEQTVSQPVRLLTELFDDVRHLQSSHALYTIENVLVFDDFTI